MTRCLYCEQALPKGAQFCPSCGALVSHCPICEHLIYNEARFCGTCGTDLREFDMGPNAMARRARTVPIELNIETEALFRQEAAEGDHLGLLYRPSRPAQRYPLSAGDNTLGAGPKNHIVITDPAISWNHALLLCHADRILLQDTASTNGTFLNSVRVQRPMGVEHGDTIRLADVNFILWLIGARR